MCDNDKFIKPYVDFINSNFNKKEHLFICKKSHNNVATPFPYDTNVVKASTYRNINFGLKNIKKIICHSLFDQEIIDILYTDKSLLKKSYWMIWGGDLYTAKDDEANNYVRKHIKAYISDTDGDNEVAIKKYKSKPLTYNAGYTFPITLDMVEKHTKKPHDFVLIQVNNSCDKTTIDMLKTLSKFADKNIKVWTVLSYGQTEYKHEIMKLGKKLFRDKFYYIDQMMTPAEYAGVIKQNDILILNQDRQQGLGNSFANLVSGAKVFIKSTVTTYNHFNSKGIKVFDTYSIQNSDFDDFISYKESVKQNNIKKAKIFFDNKYLKSLWEDIFND